MRQHACLLYILYMCNVHAYTQACLCRVCITKLCMRLLRLSQISATAYMQSHGAVEHGLAPNYLAASHHIVALASPRLPFPRKSITSSADASQTHCSIAALSAQRYPPLLNLALRTWPLEAANITLQAAVHLSTHTSSSPSCMAQDQTRNAVHTMQEQQQLPWIVRQQTYTMSFLI